MLVSHEAHLTELSVYGMELWRQSLTVYPWLAWIKEMHHPCLPSAWIKKQKTKAKNRKTKTHVSLLLIILIDRLVLWVPFYKIVLALFLSFSNSVLAKPKWSLRASLKFIHDQLCSRPWEYRWDTQALLCTVLIACGGSSGHWIRLYSHLVCWTIMTGGLWQIK